MRKDQKIFDNKKFAMRFLILALLICTVSSSLSGCALIFGKDFDKGDLLDDVELDISNDIKLEETTAPDSDLANTDTGDLTKPSTETDPITDNNTAEKTDPSSSTLVDRPDNSGFGITEEESVSSNETDFTKIVAKTEKSVVEINTETAMYSQWSGQYIVEGAGSGVIISRDSKNPQIYYIVTNNHVIDSAETITVRLYDGKEFDATLIATDEMTDVALLSVTVPTDTPTLEVAVMAHSENVLYNGQDIYVIGNPLGELGGSVSKGIISKTARKIKIDGIKMDLMQIDAAVNPGNSGGALFDMNGKLIGIVNAKYSEEGIEGLGFAIPINTVKHVLSELAAHGFVTGRTGFVFSVVDEAYLSSSGSTVVYPTINDAKGAVGTYTDESGTNQSFTFEAGNVILGINGEGFNSTAGMQSVLSEYSMGDTVAVKVGKKTLNGRYYSWEYYTVDVVLSEYVPANK